MKKLLYVLFILSLSVSFVACGGDEDEEKEKNGVTLIVTVIKNDIPLKNVTVRIYEDTDLNYRYDYLGNGIFNDRLTNIMFSADDQNIPKKYTDSKGECYFQYKSKKTYSFTIDLEDEYRIRVIESIEQDTVLIKMN